MRYYLAGPMTGIIHFGFPAFDSGKALLESEGHAVFSPADNDRRLMGKSPDWLPEPQDGGWNWKTWTHPGAPNLRTMIGQDLQWICDNADAIAMLPGWENSKGAKAEWHLALCLGLKIRYL